jgi:hypothetical protein
MAYGRETFSIFGIQVGEDLFQLSPKIILFHESPVCVRCDCEPVEYPDILLAEYGIEFAQRGVLSSNAGYIRHSYLRKLKDIG